MLRMISWFFETILKIYFNFVRNIRDILKWMSDVFLEVSVHKDNA